MFCLWSHVHEQIQRELLHFKSHLLHHLQEIGIQYVGQTKRELKMRLSEHFLKITRNDPDSEIAGHFNSAFQSTVKRHYSMIRIRIQKGR